jgi:lincosamide nucleotidyltransferase A/C/D/E
VGVDHSGVDRPAPNRAPAIGDRPRHPRAHGVALPRRCASRRHSGAVTLDHGMSAEEVLAVLDAVRSTGCRYWLEGGWGVDALVGGQTRPHRDVDVDIDAEYEAAVLDALAHLGYVLETDWRPNRMELAAPGGRWADLHPLVLDDEGGARQAALGGGWHDFPPHWAATGSVSGVTVPCVSVEAQRLFHTGYDLRDVDRHDVAVLDHLRGQLGVVTGQPRSLRDR